MVAGTRPETIEQYTQRVFDGWKLRAGASTTACLIVVAKDDRPSASAGCGLKARFPHHRRRVIREYMAPKFRNGDYAGGIADATAQLVKLDRRRTAAGTDERTRLATATAAATGCSRCSPPSSSQPGRAQPVRRRRRARIARRRTRRRDLMVVLVVPPSPASAALGLIPTSPPRAAALRGAAGRLRWRRRWGGGGGFGGARRRLVQWRRHEQGGGASGPR